MSGLTLLEIFDTIDSIEAIDPEKTDTPLPEIPKGVSMKKAKAYMDVFLETIPRVSLIAYPEYTQPKKEPRKRKTHSEKRAEEKIESKTRQNKKEAIIEEVQDIQIRLEGFRQHWEKRHKEVKRSIFRINNAIEIAKMGKKGHDDLLTQKTTKEQELKMIETRMQDENLVDHVIGFDDLMKERASLQRKIQRIRN